MEQKSEMFSSADGQVQAGRFHFWQQQELLLTQPRQMLQAGLAGPWKVTLLCTIVSLLLFPPPHRPPFPPPYPPILAALSPLSQSTPPGPAAAKPAAVGDKYVLNVKHRFKGSV